MVSDSDLMRSIQDLYPESVLMVSVHQDFCVVSVQPLPLDEFPNEVDFDDYPNSHNISRYEDQAVAAVYRYRDRDISAALQSMWRVLSGMNAPVSVTS